jgi:hypothetical protein
METIPKMTTTTANHGFPAQRAQDPQRGRIVLLAPRRSHVPCHFVNVHSNAPLHGQLRTEMQRLRGGLYLEDGAVQPAQISRDGCHREQADQHAWHVLMLNRDGSVYGCSRYVVHPSPISFGELGVSRSALSASPKWGRNLRAGVESKMEVARKSGVAFVEVGGWALAPEMRYSFAALRIALATYGLARLLGGGIGIATATLRHHSASILRRIGGRSLTGSGYELPRYFDSQFGCQMEILCFDSAAPNPRFATWIDETCRDLTSAPVIREEHSLLNLHDAFTNEQLEESRSRHPWLEETSMLVSEPGAAAFSASCGF